ncbi:Similar to hmu: Halomucin (Haloquadratum walsbyi (strain DSM 16790 / HBSQ001)) [Cotesia congregata]|uniref:Similar to hmu: Halomucin (Haloquadratum walsbyi (Strain DSM 16790 / HBSQ001)) n=1 Tax=Cotesia congregata TaxID=51543 RepID=A0A8J2MI73_COTCN|nr:Similar to hmu: Halomucin (Haloquadratum walsbyi (strain DSM 16790 / HBSQ001)) [Cotesia congregata]
MDYTKTYCIIERNRNDFIIFPTKYIYFEDDKNRVLPISEATGIVETFFAYENGRVKQIKKIIKCSDNMAELQKSMETGKRLKVKKNLSFATEPESAAAKKKRLAQEEKQKANSKKKPRSNNIITSAKDKNNNKNSNETNKHTGVAILEDDSQNTETGSDNDAEDFENNSNYQILFDDTLPVLEGSDLFEPNYSSTPPDSPNHLMLPLSHGQSGHDQSDQDQSEQDQSDQDQNDQDQNDHHQSSHDQSDRSQNSRNQNTDNQNSHDDGSHGQSSVRDEESNDDVMEEFFNNLWPEASSSSVLSVNVTQLKQCFKEFGGHMMGNIIKVLKKTQNKNDEYEIPPVINNKIKILGSLLDAEELLLAKDVTTMRICANHVIRAFWPLEERKKLVLSNRSGQPAGRVTIKQDDVEKIKSKYC